MVVGKVTYHYVEVVYDKQQYKVSCSCRWNKSATSRPTALQLGHLHLAGSEK
jgi:hypothetical protein